VKGKLACMHVCVSLFIHSATSLSSFHPDSPFSVNHLMTYIGLFPAFKMLRATERLDFPNTELYISAVVDNKCHYSLEVICRFNYNNENLTMWSYTMSSLHWIKKG